MKKLLIVLAVLAVPALLIGIGCGDSLPPPPTEYRSSTGILVSIQPYITSTADYTRLDFRVPFGNVTVSHWYVYKVSFEKAYMRLRDEVGQAFHVEYERYVYYDGLTAWYVTDLQQIKRFEMR